MTFIEYIDAYRRVGINHIPKHAAELLLRVYPSRFPMDICDNVKRAIEVVNGDTINIDFYAGVQHSYLSIQEYDERSKGLLVDDYIEWDELDWEFGVEEDPCDYFDINIEDLI